ncbi:hypothetical protein [Candidatus Viadribacter manganicus]|nr:hypothetical protein [Candidatus Viadribacter manganicus]
MTTIYTATLRQNPGRRSFIVEFRHPLRTDPATPGRAGRKVRKGLGTEDARLAQRLVDELNKLLADGSLHSPAARARASGMFTDRVVEIFYDGLESKPEDYRRLRDDELPFPAREEGCPRILFLGAPGAGKTTLIRQLIGAHPTRDRFPATSVNRTTTAETEVIVGADRYAAVVTFMSEEEADFEVRQCVSAALWEAIDPSTPDATIAKALLERSDMRFRLKYALGDWPTQDEDDDPYETQADIDDAAEDATASVSKRDQERLEARLKSHVSIIHAIAAEARWQFEHKTPEAKDMAKDERTDAIQVLGEELDAYGVLVSDLLEDLKSRFDAVEGGAWTKTTTGWPRAWRADADADARQTFLEQVRFFSGNDRRRWGTLLTPLVNGVRVAGPFRPEWSDAKQVRMVLIDTEGVGHKASASVDVPDYVVARFPDCDAIVLMHSGVAPFGYDGGKILEAIGASGHTAKTLIAFTRMDSVRGDNLGSFSAKKDHVFGGVRNVLENQLAKLLTEDVARQMLTHLRDNAFYLGSLQQASPDAAKSELNALLVRLTAGVEPPAPQDARPTYADDLWILAVHQGVSEFRAKWRGYLGLDRDASTSALPWQSVKAMSRRYAEGFDDGYHVRPASNLLQSMSTAIAQFVERPLAWEGAPNDDDKRVILDAIKSEISRELARFCRQQLREKPQPQWQEAHGFSGTGSARRRHHRIEELYEEWAPIPASSGQDLRRIQEFAQDVRTLVGSAVVAALEKLDTKPNPSGG